MGRLESLTALALVSVSFTFKLPAWDEMVVENTISTTASLPQSNLVNIQQIDTTQGRGHYEEEVIINPEPEPLVGPNPQQYNDRGYPRNPETKRQEREHVRAANEVMQVTGVVEDSQAATQKQHQLKIDKNQETFTGLRLLEFGRAVFIGGIWGVLGLRKRILVRLPTHLQTTTDTMELYKPYSDIGVLQIMQHEASKYSIHRLLVAGLPAVLTYHVCDWVLPVAGTIILRVFETDEDGDALAISEPHARIVDGIQSL